MSKPCYRDYCYVMVKSKSTSYEDIEVDKRVI